MIKNNVCLNANQDSIKEKEGSWYLDNGCSNHMAKDETIFKSIDKSVKVKVRLENGNVFESKGKGIVTMDTYKDTRLIPDFLLVPTLKENLLSIGQMTKRGYTLHFEECVYKILENKNKWAEIAQVKMDKGNNSFPLNLKYATNIIMKV